MISKAVSEEIAVLVEELRDLLDDLAVRGLANAGAGERARLERAGEELDRLGAVNLARFFHRMVQGLRSGGRCGDELFRARSGLQLFESLTSREVALAALDGPACLGTGEPADIDISGESS